MGNRSNTEEFIKKAKEKHGEKYDYSKVEYINNSTKVCIVCPVHGEFNQSPNAHLSGHGCKQCANKIRKRLEKETFIERSNKIHNHKYNYLKVNYINSKTKVCIICPLHGEFWQTPTAHMEGNGCKLCGNEKQYDKLRHDSFYFINKSNIVHNNKYDYSKVEYLNSRTKVCIICPIHGEFWQNADSHLRGHGCQKCVNTYHYTTKEWIEEAKKIHNNKYDYSKSIYKGSKKDICIICTTHGEFLQRPNTHLNGHGCPKCKSSHIEEEIINLLLENNIKFDYQKKFEWLGLQSLDFFIPKYNVAIECQGIQHFQNVDYFGGENGLKQRKEKDKIKRNLCNKNGIKLLYYANYEYNFPYDVIVDKEELIRKIIDNEETILYRPLKLDSLI